MNYAPEAPIATEQGEETPPSTAHTTQPPIRARTWKWTLAQRNRSRRKAAFLRAINDTTPGSQTRGRILASCHAAGINHTTYARWRHQYPAFDRAVLDAITATEHAISDSMIARALNPDDRTGEKAGEFMLKALNRDKYGDQTKVEQTTTINHQIQIVQAVQTRIQEAQQQRLQRLKTIDAQEEENP